jgi:hypothetical protein
MRSKLASAAVAAGILAGGVLAATPASATVGSTAQAASTFAPHTAVRTAAQQAAKTHHVTLPAPKTNKGGVQANCSGWINIGNPGNFYYYGEYAGQVEQIYNTCDGTVKAHWQWAGGFQQSHPGAQVVIDAATYNTYNSGVGYTWSKDVYSSGQNIHDGNPDNWYVDAFVTYNGGGCGPTAQGDWHVYANGGTFGSPLLGGCWSNGAWVR